MLIDAQPDLQLAAQVSDIADLLLQVKQLQPELIVLDWETIGTRIDTLQQLLELFEEPPLIVALSVHQQARNAAFDSGVVGFAYKGDPPDRLLRVIRETQPGQPWPSQA
jgi:DNA-binding NarL/FixJ family response regulator